MSYFELLRIFHILLAALYVGAAASMAVLWMQGGRAGDAEMGGILTGILAVGRRVSITAGSLLILVGLLMMMDRPSLFGEGPLLYLKIALGIGAVGLSHVAQARVRQVRDAAEVGDDTAGAEKSAGLALKLAPVIALTVVLLGILIAHG